MTGVVSLVAASLVALLGLAYTWTGQGTGTFQARTASVTPPSNLACTPTGLFSRQLQWEPSPLADGYRVYHDGPFWDDDFELLEQVAAPATTYDEVWPSFFHHRWYVTTVSGSWESGPSNVIEVHCRPALFFPGPFGLDGENHHSERVVAVTWEPAAGAVLYGVFRAEQSGGPYEMVGTTESTTHEDTAVQEGVTYYYVVVAVDGQGNESDPSPEIAVPDSVPADSPTTTPIAESSPTPEVTPTTDAPQPTTTGTPTPTWMMGPDREPPTASTPTWMIGPDREPPAASTPTWMIGPGPGPTEEAPASEPSEEPATLTPETTATATPATESIVTPDADR